MSPTPNSRETFLAGNDSAPDPTYGILIGLERRAMYSKEPALASRGFSIVDHGGKSEGGFSIQVLCHQPFRTQLFKDWRME